MSIEQENMIQAIVDISMDNLHNELNTKYPGYMNSNVSNPKSPVAINKCFKEFEDNLVQAIRWHVWIDS